LTEDVWDIVDPLSWLWCLIDDFLMDAIHKDKDLTEWYEKMEEEDEL